MTAAMKFYLVIVALVCCMQFVEMARLRRDEPAPPAPPAFDINVFLEQIKNSEIVKQFQEIKPEQFQEKFVAGYNSIKESFDKNVAEMKPEVEARLKTLQVDFEQNKGKTEDTIKEIMQTLSKTFAPPPKA